MLVHVTMTHTVEECLRYNADKRPDFLATAKKIEAVAKESKVKIDFLVNGAPEHVMFALMEAENPIDVTCLQTIALRQDFKVTPVTDLQELIARTEERMSQY